MAGSGSGDEVMETIIGIIWYITVLVYVAVATGLAFTWYNIYNIKFHTSADHDLIYIQGPSVVSIIFWPLLLIISFFGQNYLTFSVFSFSSNEVDEEDTVDLKTFPVNLHKLLNVKTYEKQNMNGSVLFISEFDWLLRNTYFLNNLDSYKELLKDICLLASKAKKIINENNETAD